MPAEKPKPDGASMSLRPVDFSDPVKIIYADHARIRTCCEQLVWLADNLAGEDAAASADSILRFLEIELPRHVVDEEQGLFPLLGRRARRGDRIAPVVELLREEHRDDVEFGHALLEPLYRIATGHQPSDPAWFRYYVHTFETLQRRHHALEDKVIMPLAVDRLTEKDKAEFGRSMAARRGMDYPD